MHVVNRTSRYHVVMQAAEKIAARFPNVSSEAEDLLRRYKSKIRQHRQYIRDFGMDPPEIANWKFRS
jgi:xylulose-5-phosphate/fructose-6-phosphate phosphoketolase